MQDDQKFKKYGKFKIFECIVEINENCATISSNDQSKAQICAKYLFNEGFVDSDQMIEFKELKN
jgi:hypothetical protein